MTNERYTNPDAGGQPQKLYTRREILQIAGLTGAGAAVTCGPLGAVVGWIGNDQLGASEEQNGAAASDRANSSHVEASIVPIEDPQKNFNEVVALRDGEAHTFSNFAVDTFWVVQGLGTEAYVAASTRPSNDRRLPYAALVNAQCLYDAARPLDAFKEADRQEQSLVPGQSLTRVVLKEPILFPRLHVRAGRSLPHELQGRILEATSIQDEAEIQVSCEENNLRQDTLVTALLEGRALTEIPNTQ